MENAIIPTGKAHEPNECARNPMTTNVAPNQEHQSRRQITFADDTCSEKSTSQSQARRSSSLSGGGAWKTPPPGCRQHNLSSYTAAIEAIYKDVLSQPAAGLSHLQKLLWLQKRRSAGLWVQCDDCDRWRFLPNVLDAHELPNKWVCRMNPDSSNANCSVPETPIRLREEEDLIHSLYSTGSVVWARMPGWPWWPAMVDDCPDTEQFYWLDGFSDIPTHYNVVFFDSTEVTRGWIAPDNLKPYAANKSTLNKNIGKKYTTRLLAAMKNADDASKKPLGERLEKYSFIAQYKGKIGSPKKVTKKDLIKFQKKMKKQYDIDLPIEKSDSDSDDEPVLEPSPMKRRNMIILGTPKRARSIQEKTHVETAVSVVEQGALSQTQTDSGTPVCPIKMIKPKKLIQDSMNVSEESSDWPKEKPDTAATISEFKHPNSMVVQVGSTAEIATESYDNDTSKTYVPDLRQSLESTDNETEMGTQEFETRATTPNSDDFDF